MSAFVVLGISACEMNLAPDFCWAGPCTPQGPVFVATDRTALGVGETLQLSLTDGGSARWTSEAPSIAKVSSSGVATGVSVGRVRIRASRSSSPAVSASVELDVFPALCTADSVRGPIASGETVTGDLSLATCGVLVHFGYGAARGARASGWRFLMDSTRLLRLDITSSGFRPSVLVTDATFAATPPGSGYFSTSTAYGVFAVPAGEHIAWAASESPPGVGSFILEATMVAECNPAAVAGDTIRPGQSLPGTLSRNDCHTRHGGPGDVWRLVVESRERVFIGLFPLSSSLFGSVGYVGADGRVSVPPPEGLLLDAGVHTLLAQGHGGGDYLLIVSR